MLLALDRLPEFDGLLGTQRLGLCVRHARYDARQVNRHALADVGRELLQHAGSVAAVSAESVAGIGLLHRADLAWIQIVDFDP